MKAVKSDDLLVELELDEYLFIDYWNDLDEVDITGRTSDGSMKTLFHIPFDKLREAVDYLYAKKGPENEK